VSAAPRGSEPSPAAVAAARAALEAGEVAVLPTDTVYGLAAALDVPAGVERLYALKGRPRAQPVQVLLYASAALEEAARGLAGAAGAALRLLLPGPATCIVADPRGRFDAAAGDAPGGVGLRAPRVEGALAGLDLPLVATSANRPGGPDPATLDDVPEGLRRGAAAELDAGRLPGTASAVVDLRPLDAGAPALLLRPGPDPAGLAALLARAGLAVRAPGDAVSLGPPSARPRGGHPRRPEDP
jgi:L-threonylcarbamoyladenylate synthase